MQNLPLSIHRLPKFYRYSLTLLWLALPALLLGTVLISRGMQLALFDPRMLLLLLVMVLPAIHIWQQGVDVYDDGLLVRIHLPNFHAYERLKEWQLESHPQGHILSITDYRQAFVMRFHAAHLSDLPLLIQALDEHIA